MGGHLDTEDAVRGGHLEVHEVARDWYWVQKLVWMRHFAP